MELRLMMLPPSATEPLDRRLPSENHPENVDVIVGVKALLGNFREGAKAEYPGVVDQNVQSSERGIHFLEQARDFRGLGHVGPDCDRIASAVRDRLSNPFGASPVGGIVHSHLRAAKAVAIPLPMPLDAPVTIATLLDSLLIIHHPTVTDSATAGCGTVFRSSEIMRSPRRAK
jgi:hypothetical protein